MTVAMGWSLLVVGWSLWVGRCWSRCALCRSFCNDCFVSLVSALWDNGWRTVAVGRLLWVGYYGLVTIGWSLLVVVGRSLYVFASCWCLLCKGCLVMIVLCWLLIVGFCGTVAVGRSLWFGSYWLWAGCCWLLWVGHCGLVAGLSLSQSIAMILIICMHLRKNFHCKASGVAGGAAGGNLNRPPPLSMRRPLLALEVSVRSEWSEPKCNPKIDL